MNGVQISKYKVGDIKIEDDLEQKIGVPKEAHTFNYFSFSTIKLAF